MKITIPLNAELYPEELTELLRASGHNIRAAYCKKTSSSANGSTMTYAFVSTEDMLFQATLIRVSLTSNTYKVSKLRSLGGFESMWHALQHYNKLRPISHSGGRPLQAILYPLSMVGMQANPNLDQILYNWCNTQEVIPLTYAVYNPREDAIELGLQDPNARNSSARMRVIERSVFSELKKYLEKHPEVGEYDKEAMNQIIDPSYYDTAPRSQYKDQAKF